MTVIIGMKGNLLIDGGGFRTVEKVPIVSVITGYSVISTHILGLFGFFWDDS